MTTNLQLGVEQTLGAEKGESECDEENVTFSVLEDERIFPEKTGEIFNQTQSGVR